MDMLYISNYFFDNIALFRLDLPLGVGPPESDVLHPHFPSAPE